MSEEAANGAATPAEAAGPVFTVEKIYVKDVSFEVPGAPAVFNEQAQPQLQMNLQQAVQRHETPRCGEGGGHQQVVPAAGPYQAAIVFGDPHGCCSSH